MDMAIGYYTSIFTSECTSATVLAAREEIWSFVTLVVSDALRHSLLSPFVMREVEVAIDAIDAFSCPVLMV